MLARLGKLRLFREAHFHQCHGKEPERMSEEQREKQRQGRPSSSAAHKDDNNNEKKQHRSLENEYCRYDTPFQLRNFVLEANSRVKPVQHGNAQFATDVPPLCATEEHVQEARQLRLIIPASTREQFDIKPTLRRSRDGDRSSMNIYQHLPLFHFRLHKSSQQVVEARGGYDAAQTFDLRRHCVGGCLH